MLAVTLNGEMCWQSDVVLAALLRTRCVTEAGTVQMVQMRSVELNQ